MVHQKLTRTSRGLHQSYVVGFTRRAVILKESRGQHPQTQNHSFKAMTTFNTDYNNTELLDQELSIHELQAVAGGKSGIDRLFELPDSLLTPQQRKQRDRVGAMREAGTD